ncbi:MAG TPA: PKD domain-containing protein, partial [Bacteroidia bacterium]|nr:PKD domain-containing protein [Bacteroidia bacterium]
MIKKLFLVLVFFVTSIFVRAQIQPIEYPTNTLSEEKIQNILENLRKHGTKDDELQKTDAFLHVRLKQQNDAMVNGTWVEKTILPPPSVQSSPCNNPGFETGNTTGWTFTQGSASGATLPCPTCFTGGAGGVYQVTTVGTAATINSNSGNNTSGNTSGTCQCSNTNTNDCTPQPYNAAGTDRFGGFSVVAPAPLGGTHSLMINNSNCGYLMQRASFSFVVSNANASFTFQYAAVLQDGGHTATESPYFNVYATDLNTNAVVPCSQYSTTATSGNLSGWTVSSTDASVYYKPWQTVTLNFSGALTHTVVMNFEVSDCNAGGHFGYAYIDASCNPLQITKDVPLCPGKAAVLSGPPGMASYSWNPTSATTQSITTSTIGTYTLTTTSANGCPSPALYYTLTQDPNPVPSFTYSNPPCSGALSFTDQSTIAAPDTITHWVWNFGDGTPSVNATSDAAQNHGYTTPGAYTVTLTDTTNAHCVSSYSFVVNAGGGGPVPSFSSNSPSSAPQCLVGNNVVFTNSSTTTGSVTITGYNWDFGDGSTGTSTTASPNTSHSYTASGTYVVTLTVNVTGCASTTTQTVVISPMPTATISAPPVCLGNATVFTSTVTNGSTYMWDYGDGGAPVAGTATPSHTYTAANTYVVTVTVTSAAPASCTGTASTSVVVSPVPTAAFTVAPVCMGTPSVFDATASTPSAGTYNWSFGGAAPNTDVITGVQTDNHTYTSAGTFPVTLLLTVGSCSATATGNAIVNPNATAAISTSSVCLGAATVFTSTIT